MSHKNILRKDKTCLNCNYVVENRFCPNCGQENTTTRKTFHHLFIHFFEDLTHYENAFWKTIKNLILHPASLTIEYLSGKRLSYLAPIRLYIFISFVTFFLISLLPNDIEKKIKDDEKEKMQTESTSVGKINIIEDKSTKLDSKDVSSEELKLKSLFDEGKLTKKEYDTLVSYTQQINKKQKTIHFGNNKYNSIKELDSVQKFGKDKLGPISYWFAKKLMKVTQNKTLDEIFPLFLESFKHNIPKALFVYMPLFAFLLWLFHDKKKWYYFDHGIFTLHYFSFMLLLILISTFLLRFIFLFGENSFTDLFENFIDIIVPLWFIYYFYRASKKFYQGSRTSSFIKSSIILVLNTILMSIVLLFFIIYSFITIH